MYMYVPYVCTTAQPNILYDVHWGCVYLISSLAEELFMRSWKVYETLFGESHLMVVRPLRNLAFFYMQRDKWVVCVCLGEHTPTAYVCVSIYTHFTYIQPGKSYFSVRKGTWNLNAGIVCHFFVVTVRTCMGFFFCQNQVGQTEQMIDVTGKLATLYRQQVHMYMYMYACVCACMLTAEL